MKNISIFAPVLLAFSLALLPAARGAAQEPDPSGNDADDGSRRAQRPETPDPKRVTLSDIRFDLEFVDVPASEAFEFIAMQIQEKGGDPLNIVYSKAAEAINLPTMTLRQITFEQFVCFINRIGGAPQHSGGDPFAADGKTRIHALKRQTSS